MRNLVIISEVTMIEHLLCSEFLAKGYKYKYPYLSVISNLCSFNYPERGCYNLYFLNEETETPE